MPKGQQRGNREAKKPKKAPQPAPVPGTPASLTPTRDAAAARWPKK